MFEIDKKRIVEKFKDFLQSRNDSDESSDDKEFDSISKKDDYSKYDILQKVLSLYEWVLKNSLLDLRKTYIHDDNEYTKIKNKLISYIKNKIRTTSDGKIHVKINDLVTLNGDKDQYEEWLVTNKGKQNSVLRNIVDELNNFLQGNPLKEDEKPVLNDLNENFYVNFILNYIPESSFINEDIFEEDFEKAMIKLNISREHWRHTLVELKTKLFTNEIVENTNES